MYYFQSLQKSIKINELMIKIDIKFNLTYLKLKKKTKTLSFIFKIWKV